ncbi:MAG: heavy-metal-associated domain-containing protein [Acidobacteriota bacterium]
MTRRSNLAPLVVLLAALPAAGLAASADPDAGRLQDTTLTIRGMTCGGCVAAVKHRLGRIEGVARYEVSLKRGEAEVTFDPSLTDPEAIAAAVSETGFEATVKDEEKEAGPEHESEHRS